MDNKCIIKTGLLLIAVYIAQGKPSDPEICIQVTVCGHDGKIYPTPCQAPSVACYDYNHIGPQGSNSCVCSKNSVTLIAQTSRKCSDTETCETRANCPYVTDKFAEIQASTETKQRKGLIDHLKSKVCNREKRGYCCPPELLKHLGLEVIQDDRILLPIEIKNGLTTLVKDFVTFYPDISVVFPEKCKFFLSQPSDFRSLLSMYKNGDLRLSQINLINLEAKCEADDVNDMSDLLLKVNDVWFHSDQDVEMWQNLAIGAASGKSDIDRVYLSSGLTAQDENIDYLVDICLYTSHFEINDINMEPKHWKKLSNKLQRTSNKTAVYMGLGYNRRENFAHISEAVLSVESVGLWNNFADTPHHWELFFKAAEERRKVETQALKTIWIYEAYAGNFISVEIKAKAMNFGIDLKTECKYWYEDC